MSITQLNATYVQEQDRVMFRFNTSESHEYRLWFTRLVVKELLRLMSQASVAVLAREHPIEHAKAIAEFKQQAKTENPQFTTFEPAPHLPLGGEPVLVHGMRLHVEPGMTVLELLLPKEQVMTLRLTEDMLGQMRLLLQTIEQHAAWGLTHPDAKQSLTHEAQPGLDAAETANPKKRLH